MPGIAVASGKGGVANQPCIEFSETDQMNYRVVVFDADLRLGKIF